MSELRRLALSVLLPGFVGTGVPSWLAARIEEGLAGVCLFGQNVDGADQVRALTADLRRHRPSLLVASDEEGGTVTRLEAGQGSSWPGHAALGALDDPSATYEVARGVGAMARRTGVDLVLAPVVDVNSDPRNPVIGIRAFGDRPALVTRHAVAFVRGVQASGAAACVKHFPGHGATAVDSHVGLPVLRADLDEVRRRDLPPFAAAVEAGVRCVMTAHVVLRALDDERPATTSPAVLRVLRDELGFSGVVVSDALDMGAVSRTGGRAAGAVAALSAGVDLLCVGNPVFPEPYDDEAAVEEIVSALVSAVADGALPLRRLEEASSRVGDLAVWLGSRAPETEVDLVEQRRLAGRAARRALRVRGDVTVPGPALVAVTGGTPGFAAGRRDPAWVAALLGRRPDWECVAVREESVLASLADRAGDRTLVVVVTDGPSSELAGRLRDLVDACPDAVLVYAGLPGPDDPGCRTVHSLGGGRATADAVADLISEGVG